MLRTLLFGTAARSVNDFGTQGELPSHPELLDWLATEFIANGGTTRRCSSRSPCRRPTGSRRPSTASPRRLIRTIAFWHGRLRHRLSAEEVRDNALAIAGLLNRKVGGPSVMLYQPAGFYNGKYEIWKWTPSTGDDLYRRGLYTFWRRTSLHPMLAVFDAPSREDCTAFRPAHEHALAGAGDTERSDLRRGGPRPRPAPAIDGPRDHGDRLVVAFRVRAAARPMPRRGRCWRRNTSGCTPATRLIRRRPRAVKAGRYPPAEKLDVVEHAAWMAPANLLLNLDETVTRE